MDGSEKKRVSKWDLQETQFPLENAQDNVFPDNLTAVKYSRHSPEVAGDNGSKWSSMETDDMQKAKHDYARPVRERLSGSRGSQKNDNINKDSSEYLEATMEWERDGSYNMRTSPGFDRRRHQNRSRSPKSSWSRSIRSRSRSRSRTKSRSRSRSRSKSKSKSKSRSRSRSRTPPYGFKRELFVNNRSRSRSRVPTQPCKDFAAGRCRRGSYCPFLHEANQRYEDRRYPEGGLADNWESRHRKSGASRYPDPYDTRERERSIRGGRDTQCCNDFLKGKCQRGSSCRYSHDDGLVNEAIHDRENDQRNRGASFAHDDASDGYGKSSANEVIRDRENDRRNRGASFARDGASDGYGKSSANEVIRDRENDRRNRGASFAHDGALDGYGRSFSNEVMRDRESDRRNRGASFDRGFEREPRRNGTIPCKFFAAGNCRNGNHCRFYHDVHASVSPGKRSRDDRWGMDRRADNADPWMEAPKWNDRTSLSDGLNLHEEKIDVINPESRIDTWDMDSRREHNLENRTQCGLTSTDKSEGKEILQWKAENSGASLGVSESRGNDKWLGDMPPEWNYQVQSSDLVKEDQTSHIAQSTHPPSLNKSSLPTPEWEYGMPSSDHIIKEEPSQINHTSQSLDLDNTSEWDYGVRASNHIIKGEPGQIKPSSLNHNNASEWDYGVQASDHIIKGEPGQINQNSLNHSNTSLPTSEWDYGVCTSDHIIKEKPGQINQSSKKHSKTSSQTSEWDSGRQASDVTDEESARMNQSSLSVINTSLPTPEQDITREASGQILTQHSAPPMQPIIYQQPFFQQTSISMGNSAAAIGPPYNNNTVAISQNHQNFPANNFPGQSFDQNNQSGQPPSSLNGVGQGQGQGQLQPLANLSTSRQPLSNFNGVGQGHGKNQSQLPHPSNPNPQIQPSFQDMKSSNNADTSGILRPTQNMVSSEQLAQIAQFLPQIYGSVNPPKSMEIVAPVSSASIQPNLAVGSQNQYDPLRDINDQIKSNLSNHPPGFSSNPIGQETIMGRKSELTAKSEVAQENNGTVVAEEKKKMHEETKKVRESSPEGDGDGKKCKDVKGIRSFKFSLVEFVKELLKPAWKEGQIGKEAYKTIAKKVVDKVTGTIQGAHIPQTQEKIDQYLSFSKPKLTKLVHAYVEKHQKG